MPNNIVHEAKITQSKFNNLCAKLFDNTLTTVTKVLTQAKMDKSEIDEVILIGRSTRIPEIQKKLQDFFGPETKFNKSIRQDEAGNYLNFSLHTIIGTIC